VRYFNIKPKNNRGIVGISGILLLILGVVSLIFQSSTTVQVYGQVDLGPLVNIGPPDRSNSQDSDSDGTDIFIAYGAQGVYLGKILSGSGGRGEAEQDNPRLIIQGGTDPAIDVTPGGQVYVAAGQAGEIAFVECADDDDNCEPAESVSNPDTEPSDEIEGEGSTGSCTDNLDNDADGRIDVADTDCKFSSEQESSQRGLCSDGVDNDEDGVTDSDDEDCFHSSETAGAEDTDTAETAGAEDTDTAETAGAEDTDTAETAGAEDTDTAGVEPTSFNLQPGTTSSPQLTFVTTEGGDAPTASNTDIAASNDGSDVYVVWEQEGEIMLAASHDGGETWGEIVNVSNTPGASTDPRVATSANGENVHVTWQDTPGNGDIFYARSTNGGQTFETSINLSNTSGRSDDHQLLAEGSNVYVVWVDYTTRSGGDIYFRKSNDNGGTFSNTINLSAGSGQSFQANRDPDMAAQGSKVSVTWAAYPDRNAVRAGEILFRESLNSGSTFGNSVNVSQTPRTDSKEPQVDYTPESGERYLAFHDTGGPRRVNTTPDTYNVLATESDNGRTFSALVNLSDAPNNAFKEKNTSQLEVIFDVGIWDPTSRRG
jgi:hypothetical protein